jgi:hypothetical protein
MSYIHLTVQTRDEFCDLLAQALQSGQVTKVAATDEGLLLSVACIREDYPELAAPLTFEEFDKGLYDEGLEITDEIASKLLGGVAVQDLFTGVEGEVSILLYQDNLTVKLELEPISL